MYRTDGGTTFSVYQTEYAGQAGHTIAQIHVDDVVAEDAGPARPRASRFETYDMPGVEWDGDVAHGGMGKAAWFKDSEGNILCLDQADARNLTGADEDTRAGDERRPGGRPPARGGETHHRVYRITDGEDPDWATWYANWLVQLSELPGRLGCPPVRASSPICSSCWSRRSPPGRSASRGAHTTPPGEALRRLTVAPPGPGQPGPA